MRTNDILVSVPTNRPEQCARYRKPQDPLAFEHVQEPNLPVNLANEQVEGWRCMPGKRYAVRLQRHLNWLVFLWAEAEYPACTVV